MRSLLVVALLLASPAWAQDNGDDATGGRLQMRTPQGRQSTTAPRSGSSAGQKWWLGMLKDDASTDENCEVTSITNPHEGFVDGQDRATATIRCADGRTLAAVRPEEGLPFHFSACDPTSPDAC